MNLRLIVALCTVVLSCVFRVPAAESSAVDPALKAAADALEELRLSVAQERAALDRRHDEVWQTVRQLREQVREAEADAFDRKEALTALRRREADQDVTWRTIRETLTEYRRALETHLSAVDRMTVTTLLQAIDDALESPHGGVSDEIPALALVLRVAQILAADALPARGFEGTIYDDAGRPVRGRILTVGPASYFVESEGAIAGVVTADSSGMEPLLLSGISDRDRQALQILNETGYAWIPSDATGGMLLQLERAREPWWQRLRQGGVVIIPLLVIGVLCLGVAVSRFIILYRMQRPLQPDLDRILDTLQAGQRDEARVMTTRLPDPWRAVILEGLTHHRVGRAYLEEILQDRIMALAPRISAHLNTLAICAAAAPLLGLLGTVTGMIHTFQLITLFGTGDARTLSGGISEALITTQVGLIIAVPALLAHAGLARMARGVIAGLEQAAIRFVRHLDQPGGDG